MQHVVVMPSHPQLFELDSKTNYNKIHLLLVLLSSVEPMGQTLSIPVGQLVH